MASIGTGISEDDQDGGFMNASLQGVGAARGQARTSKSSKFDLKVRCAGCDDSAADTVGDTVYGSVAAALQDAKEMLGDVRAAVVRGDMNSDYDPADYFIVNRGTGETYEVAQLLVRDPSMDVATRIANMWEAAQDGFWAKVVESFPECKSGDLAADEQFAFDAACKKVITVWVESNQPANVLSTQWNAVPATGAHRGKIAAVSATEVIQHIGKDKYVAWPREKLSGKIAVGQTADISADGNIKPPPLKDCGRAL